MIRRFHGVRVGDLGRVLGDRRFEVDHPLGISEQQITKSRATWTFKRPRSFRMLRRVTYGSGKQKAPAAMARAWENGLACCALSTLRNGSRRCHWRTGRDRRRRGNVVDHLDPSHRIVIRQLERGVTTLPMHHERRVAQHVGTTCDTRVDRDRLATDLHHDLVERHGVGVGG